MSTEFDYIIVGAGTAGCLLANRLSADPSIKVCLIEAGGRDNYIWIHIPVGYLYCIGNPRTDWLYMTEPVPGLNGRAIRYPRGKVLGGCSSINGMIYMRGQRGDYDDWTSAGNPGWSWDDVLPYFRKHEDYHRLDDGSQDPQHGHGGEWRVEKIRVKWEILDAWRQAAAQTGIPGNDDFNRGDNFGCGYFEVNQKAGVRWNASKAFLRPAQHRPNLQVIHHGQVTRLSFAGSDRTRVDGVYLRRKGGVEERLACRGEVVLSSGAVHSPAILEQSGIGHGQRLAALGIEPRVELAGVGENLQDHLQLRMVYKVSNVSTLNRAANSLLGRAWMGVQYALARQGPMTMSPSQLGAFAKSSASVSRADLEWHVQPLSLDKFGDPLHPFPAFTASVCHLRPSSRGSIHVESKDPLAAPKIRPNYLSTDADREVAAAAMRLTRRIVGADALKKYSPEEFLPGVAIQDDVALAKAAGDVGTTIFHPVGTCRMGASAENGAVVDSRLRCFGVTGLRIADASVMPTITSGNTNSPTLMIAERAAEWMLADRRAGGRL